jgi:phage shock protein C
MRKLYRSSTNRLIAGVCGGLGEYFKIDPILFRILFLFTGIGFPAYVIMWIFVPEGSN